VTVTQRLKDLTHVVAESKKATLHRNSISQ